MAELPHDTVMLLGEMKAQIATMQETLAVLGAKGDDRGSRTHKELESIRLEIAQLRRDVDAIIQRMEAAESTVKEINRWKERMIGMQMLVIGIVGLLGFLAPVAVSWLKTKFGAP